ANVINTIPGNVLFSVDFRHQNPAVLEGQITLLHEAADRIASRRQVAINIDRFWTSEPTAFDPEIRAEIETAAGALGLLNQHLWSGAGHDAKYISEICPSAMIFIRSQGGLSHCEAEFSTPDDIEAGANLLLQTALAIAAG
ncbi:MAG TPA: M20/M25/M40 family metallo-hydrolase, partial [Thermomicrobiales bacterium]|nr:M20/M25/M40 family metallo-hydrolase [Thermomicrobiales bacterium]